MYKSIKRLHIIIFILSLFACSTFAQEKGSILIDGSENGFIKGKWDTDDFPPPGFVKDCQNVFVHNKKVEPIDGYTKVSTNTISVGYDNEFLWTYEKTDGTKYQLVRGSTTVHARYTGGDFNVEVATFSESYPIDAVNYDDYVYITGPSDTPIHWDGTTTTRATDIPLGRFIEVYKDCLFIAGRTGARNILEYSAQGDTSTWSTSRQEIIGKEGDVITGLFKQGDILYITTRYSIWGLQGSTMWDFHLFCVNPKKGMLFNTAQAQYQGVPVFLSNDGIYAITNELEEISGAIRETINSIEQLTPNKAFWIQTTAIDFKASTIVTQLDSTTITNSLMLDDGAYYTDGTQNYSITTYNRAQSFHLDELTYLSGIYLEIYKQGTPNALALDIRTNNSGVPSSTIQISTSIPASSFSTSSGTWVKWNFATNQTLTVDTTYWIYAYSTSSVDTSNSYAWGVDNIGDLYDDGSYWDSYSGALATRDFKFKTWVDSATYSSINKNAGTDWLNWWTLEGNKSNTDDNNNIDIYVRASGTEAGLASVGYSSYTLGTEISLTTGAWVQWKAIWKSTYPTSYPSLDDVTVNWYESDYFQNPYMIDWDNKLWFSCAISSTQNNRLLVLDGNGAWTSHNIGALAMNVYKDGLYFTPSSTATPYVYKFTEGEYKFDGESIDAYIEFPDYNLGRDRDILLDYWTLSSPETSDSDIEFKYALDKSTSYHTDNTITINMDRQTNFTSDWAPFPSSYTLCRYFKPKISSNCTNFWSIDTLGIYFSVLPPRGRR